jgi:hypothetical protein
MNTRSRLLLVTSAIWLGLIGVSMLFWFWLLKKQSISSQTHLKGVLILGPVLLLLWLASTFRLTKSHRS